MADQRLEALRAALRADAEKKTGTRSSSSGDNASYPFWDIPEKTSATLRFLPDADDSNPWFWVERQVIRLPFEGVVGGEYPTTKKVFVTVPCVDMFGDTCPIIAETRPWWKDVNGQENPLKETARIYYKKRSFLAQGFVVDSPFTEQNPPENPIRRFVLGPALLEKLKAGLADPDMEHHPTDYLNGCDFRVRKTKKGEFNNFDTSEWARRSRALTESERIAIEQYGLFNLKDFLGSRPDREGIEVIKAMFHASLNGDPFDTESFGKHYRAYGNRNDEANDVDVATTRATTKPAAEGIDIQNRNRQAETVNFATTSTSSTDPVEPVKVANPVDNAMPPDLLAKLRQRKSNQT
jgi:hypothetical protein